MQFHDKKQNVKNDNIKQIEWDNRMYFLNHDEMGYLKWNKARDKITHDGYVLLESKNVHNFGAKFNFLICLQQPLEMKHEC